MRKVCLVICGALVLSAVLGQDEGTKADDEGTATRAAVGEANKNGTQTRLFTGDSGLDSAIGGGLLGVGIGAIGALLAGDLTNPCRGKRQADGTSNRFFLGGGSNNCQPQRPVNPCGRRRRQAGDGKDARFFLGNNNNNCGPTNNFNQFPQQQQGFNQFPQQQQGFNQFPQQQQGFNQFPQQQQGFNQFPQQQQGFNQFPQQQQGFNQFQQQPQNFNQFQNQQQASSVPTFNSGVPFNGAGGGCKCQCSRLSFTENGKVQGACQTPDETGRVWCYTSGLDNNCRDLHSSQRYPNNPWSYNACSNTC